MVPENIIWAAYSAGDYQNKISVASLIGQPDPKDVYYQNTKGEWVKVTAVFDCIDKLRKTYNHGDVVYLGAVLSTTRGEIERGRKYPPVAEEKQSSELNRKEQIIERLKRSNPDKYGKILVKYKAGSMKDLPDPGKDLNGFWTTIDKYTDWSADPYDQW